MKFTVDATAIRLAASHARSTAARGGASPIMSNVLIEADEETARFKATDLQTELKATIPASIERPGSTTVPADLLNELVRKFPSQAKVHLDYNAVEEQLQIVSGSTDSNLLTLPPQDFPQFTETEYTCTFDIKVSELKRLFNKSKIAVAFESPRKYLQGVYFHYTNDSDNPLLRCVSSDGFQLTRIDTPAPEGSEEMTGVIVPHKAVVEAVNIAERETETVRISVSENKIQFTTPQLQYSTLVINGSFPDYSRLIPTENPIILTVDSSLMRKALEMLQIVVPLHGCPVLFSITQNHLRMTVNTPMTGRVIEDLEAEFSHDDMEVKFNHSHLLGVTGTVASGEITFAMKDSRNASVITPADDENALFVIMPIRV